VPTKEKFNDSANYGAREGMRRPTIFRRLPAEFYGKTFAMRGASFRHLFFGEVLAKSIPVRQRGEPEFARSSGPVASNP